MSKPNKKPAAPKSDTANVPATQGAGTAVMAHSIKLPEGFKVKRQVIMPTLNLQTGKPRTLIITGPMAVSTYVEKDPKKEKEKPATVMPVGDTADGLAYNMLVPSVLESTLRESYPATADNPAPYVGLTFYMEKLPKRPGKRYFDFALLEVESA